MIKKSQGGNADTTRALGRRSSFLAATLFIICLSIAVMGCKREYKFSKIHNDGFGLESSLRQQGFEVTTFPCDGVSNPVFGYAWRSWQGVASSNGSNSCERVAIVIRDSLNKSLNGVALDELTPKMGRMGLSKNRALQGMLLYNKDQMHGDMHIWLTPDETGQKVNYVIYQREEVLRK